MFIADDMHMEYFFPLSTMWWSLERIKLIIVEYYVWFSVEVKMVNFVTYKDSRM